MNRSQAWQYLSPTKVTRNLVNSITAGLCGDSVSMLSDIAIFQEIDVPF